MLSIKPVVRSYMDHFYPVYLRSVSACYESACYGYQIGIYICCITVSVNGEYFIERQLKNLNSRTYEEATKS